MEAFFTPSWSWGRNYYGVGDRQAILGHILGQVLTHSTSEPDAGTCTLRIRAAAGGSYGRSHRAAWCEGRAWPPGSGIPGTKDQCCGLLAVWHLGKFFKLQASVSPLENGNSASLMALLS